MTKKALIIDDMQIVRAEIRKFLCPPVSALSKMTNLIQGASSANEPEYIITEAKQGVEAVELVANSLASSTPFDVIIMDMRMPPGIDGAETLRRIRRIDNSVKVIICSAFNDYSKQELEEINCGRKINLLQKPINRMTLINAINESE